MIRIVAGTYEGLLYGWECPTVATGAATKMKLTFGYAAHAECIKSVTLMAAKQGKTLLSGGNDEMIKIYNVDKRVEVGSLMEQHGAITSLEFFGQSHINSIAVHPSGKMCFSVARDRTLRMWNLVKGRIAFIRRLEKEAELVMISQKGSRLVGKVGHKDITSRIRCMQIVYPHGEDELPWIVLATSDGAFQVWDFASFTLDEAAPEEANKSVEPMASTVLLTKPRVTCLSACVASDKLQAADDKKGTASLKTKKSKKAAGKKAASSVGAPHVVIELDGEVEGKEQADEDATSKKRKAAENSNATKSQKKNKKRKQKKAKAQQ
ncbi:hypothetical protein BBJ28_00003422 [Nothophytophthora sp. Chile5]|nr:hypothetical protein BBJ28_00003422 [Nothophytophthora sp. Chile5]